jgi:predicted SAM-dependent methyltransferase
VQAYLDFILVILWLDLIIKFLILVKYLIKLVMNIIKALTSPINIGKILINKLRFRLLLLSGKNVECNLCHYKAAKLNSDDWHANIVCPKCGSQVRQRLLWASLTLLDIVNSKKIIKDKDVLHFAPDYQLSILIKQIASKYKTADFLTEGYSYNTIDYKIDISDMKEISGASYDCLIACDVLEHVPYHINALKETYRVLKPNGYCIFTVPQKDHLEKTYEDISEMDPGLREEKFGQFDHMRIYGDDFADLLKENGFEVTIIDENSFAKKDDIKYVLSPLVKSTRPMATNYRKVFFGRKI